MRDLTWTEWSTVLIVVGATVMILLGGCAPSQVTIPTGVACVAYGQARADYGAAKILVTQACAKGKLAKADCDALVAVDTRMQVLRATVEKSLMQPETPVDWAAVLQYTEQVMQLALKLGMVP